MHLRRRSREGDIPVLLTDALVHQCLGDGLSLGGSSTSQINEAAALLFDVSGTRVLIDTVLHALSQHVDVVAGHGLGVDELLGESEGNTDLIRINVGIGSNDGTAGKVDSLAHKVGSEETLLLFEHLRR